MNPDVAFRLDLNRSPCGHYPLDEKRVLIGCGPDIVLSRHVAGGSALPWPQHATHHWAFVHINDVQVFGAFGTDATDRAFQAFNDLVRSLQDAGWADACCEGCNEPYAEDCTCEVVA